MAVEKVPDFKSLRQELSSDFALSTVTVLEVKYGLQLNPEWESKLRPL